MAGSAIGRVGGSTDSSTTSLIVNSVRLEVESFQTVESIKMYEPGKDGDESSRVYLDPLDWWRVKRVDFPHLASLARRGARHPGHAGGIGAPVLLRW